MNGRTPFKKTIYNPCDTIATVFSAVEELLKFSDIAGMYYTQLQAVNIAYVIIHRTGKFGLAICEWNRMSETQKIQTFFWKNHQELRYASDLTVEDAGMHNANMVRNVVSGLHDYLQQEQSQTETPAVVPEPVVNVANIVQNTQQQLNTQMQKMQAMMQAMKMQYSAAPQGARKEYGGRKDYGGRGYCGNQ